MTEPAAPFLNFLNAGIDNGGFKADDVLSALLTLMKQVRTTHETGAVAPLDGIQHLTVTEPGQWVFNPDQARPHSKNLSRVEALQAPISRSLEVVAESRRTTDITSATLTVAGLEVGVTGGSITKPVFLPGYRSWEHAIGHHDELTDIFSLGMLLASMACGLDFTDPAELETFSTNRDNLFSINPQINPVIASAIVQMTELNRHKRAQDLPAMISRLASYREQAADLDLNRIDGFKGAGRKGKRRMIQSHLRDRLFEISRRNRLIYFKSTMQMLNLTVASVPLLLDYRNIKLEQLFVWHSELAATITGGGPMSLGKYLRFEDAPYISGALDKIVSEARRDRAEFGFAQLRLVLCFLRWNNLKETIAERIHSPLLLLPVELTKKKGVRDNFVLDPTTSEAEVNPALRHHLKDLYNLDLPEAVDLKTTSLDRFCETLRAQIQATEPAVVLNKIDRPQIELIHEKARLRVDQYRRKMKLQGPRTRGAARPDYSYGRENFRPLGLQLFLERVRPTPIPLRDALGAAPRVRLPYVMEPLESEREMFSLRDGDNQNPYSWDFDLCSLTLGNFNYRKMTLVNDYEKLIETDMASGAFDAVFSLTPRPPEDAPPPLELNEQHLIIACDAAQASAISRARTGASYIIQGPPGTGKSQTITNLIADYVARNKRVLFVCEKRAALDVVFHRLRRQGLDELCCLIHDSQTDKKAFIQNLKQSYERFLSPEDLDAEADRNCATKLDAIDQDIASLRRFSDVMKQSHPQTGIGVRSLLHRLVELSGHAHELPPEVEELLPDYPLWLENRDVIERLRSVLTELGDDPCFGRHPLRWLGKAVLQADRPLETLAGLLDQTEGLLDAIESALELSGLPGDLWDTFEEIQAILDFAVTVRPLAERSMLRVLESGPAAKSFERLADELETHSQALAQAQKKTVGWKDPLSPEDTQNALAQAQGFEQSFFRFLQPAFWRLKKTLQSRYDFAQHTVAPAWSKVLKELAARHQAEARLDAVCENARKEWRIDDVQTFRASVQGLRSDFRSAHASVRALMKQLATSTDAGVLIESLAGIRDRFSELDTALGSLLVEHKRLDFTELAEIVAKLRGQAGAMAELSPILAEIADLPEALSNALRRVEIPLAEFEAAIGNKSINQVYRQNRAVNRFEGRTLARKMDQLEKHYTEWLSLNARRIRASVRQRFLEHVNVSSMPASQLQPEQKAFKKSYAAGRRDLEHEFGKTMRYKSIRDLAAGDTGPVIQDLKPIWLMSPLSVSDTLPLDPEYFDVVIFDEASQIPLEEAIPATYRASQVIVVGDEMQLPPTTFFSAVRGDDEKVMVEDEGEQIEVDLDSDSFLTQSAQNLPSTLLAWHYRSRYESLISFSNAAFYSGNLFTIPDRQLAPEDQSELRITSPDQGAANVDALIARSISFHFMEHGVYEDRTNPNEAAYIAQLVQGLLRTGNGLSIGIVAFSEAQQAEIESALGRLAEEDGEFSAQLEAEQVREENDVFCGLFVKNLENVQGDERDVIVMSVCYGRDPGGRMLMNFGPINQRGGEKRLNVIFSRARHHMAIVSSIRHQNITNDYNDGAKSLKNFLQYAEAVSKGDSVTARHVLENLNPLARKALAPISHGDAVVQALAKALRGRGHSVDLNVGQSRFRCDLAVRSKSHGFYQLGILVDTDGHYANPNLLDRYLMQPSILRAFGWLYMAVLTKDWYHNSDDVLSRIERLLQGKGIPEEPDPIEEEETLAQAPPIPASDPGPTLPSVAPRATGDSFRRFEFIRDASRKFWEISVKDDSFTVRFGRIGTAGQSQTKSYPEAGRAKREAESLIAEKLKKGYVERT